MLNNIKKRHVLAIYAFFGYFVAYALRANLSVAIVDMSKTNLNTMERIEDDEDVDHDYHNDISFSNSTTTKLNLLHHVKAEQWSPVLQGYILSSFFYGYIVTQLPAAFVSSKYGGKLCFGLGVGICSVLSLIMPLAAKIGPGMLIVLRIVQGLSQGFVFPSMHCLWSKWAPPTERSTLTTFALSGSYIGSVVALSSSGIISYMLNWEWIFYSFGGMGIVWCALWFRHVHETPSEHTSIGLEEKLMLESSLSCNDSTNIPWSSIVRSGAVYAIVFAHFACNWGFYTMITELPTFLAEVMKYKINKAGIVSSLPYLMMAVVLYCSGYASDVLIGRKYGFTLVRKFFCSLGLILQSLFMFMLIFIAEPDSVITLIILAVGLGGMAWASFGVNHLDIGAGYANVLMAYSNTFATIPGIVSPIITGHLIKNNTKSEWNVVFCIAAAIYVMGAVVYLIMGTGDTQYWAIRDNSLATSARFTSTLLDNECGETANYETKSTARIVSDDKICEAGETKHE